MKFHLRKREVTGNLLSDFILGGQDGLVNVLGLVLGVATATDSKKVVIIAALAALAAESISMAAVAYTSTKALQDYYKKRKEKNHVDLKNPAHSAFVVGLSSLVGSLIPLIPFFLLPVKSAMIVSIIESVIILFIAGALKAKLTVGNWKRSGIEMAVIGTIAALAGYGIGLLLGVAPL